jgi:pimeloyl-ACP methyl ester carboxylesterase
MKKNLFPILLFISFSVTAQVIPYGQNKAVGKYYTVRGIKMYCEQYGKGQPLVMIHGNGGSIESFKMNIDYFAKKYKVIIADNRAQGKSADAGDSLSYEMMADDIAALLDQLKVDSANVIGRSDGGIDGLLLAMRHPQKVKKLAITGANLWPGTTAIMEESVAADEKRIAELKKKAFLTAAEKNELKLINLMQVHPHISLEALKNIHCPTLVIAGDHDLIKPEHTLLIFQHIPKAYLWIVPNSGHATLMDQREAFNTTVANFFAQPFHAF